RLYPGQTLAQIRREARLRLLTIRHDVDAVLSLLLHRRRDSACQAPLQCLLVVWLASLLGAEHLAQVWWHWQTAGMGRQDPVRAALHLLVLLLDTRLWFTAIPAVQHPIPNLRHFHHSGEPLGTFEALDVVEVSGLLN